MKRYGLIIALTGVLLTAFLLSPIGLALADCQETSPDDHHCSGNQTGDYHADGGNDTITIDDTTNADDGIYGDDGSDTIINEGYVEDSLNGGAGDDTIINTGEDSDTGEINGDAGDDTIINNGNVGGNINGGTDDDTILNTNNVDGDINAGDGDDDVTLSGDDADVGGVIDGGNGTDTLTFEFASEDEDEILAFENAIRNADPNSGSVAWQGQLFSWLNFETLRAVLKWLGSYGEMAPEIAMLDDDALVEELDPTGGDMWALLIVNKYGPHWFTLSELYLDDGTPLTVWCLDGEGNWVDDTSIDERMEDNGSKFYVNFLQNGMCGIFTVDIWDDEDDEDNE